MDSIDTEDADALAIALEALLFVTPTALPAAALAEVTGAGPAQMERALARLQSQLEGRGIQLVQERNGYRLVSDPAYAYWVERLLGMELSSRLSVAALETLAIVAYRQPVTRAEIDAVRGVNSSATLRTLVQRELVEERGRRDAVGNPYLYGTTAHFLRYFGLPSLDALPPISPTEAARLLGDYQDEMDDDLPPHI